jgi:DNA (cytosine-5)-methyltransferase 1
VLTATDLTVTDLFCGAGGSAIGAAAAGYRLVMAANHWQRAIDTHAANFPDSEHDCADVSQVNPRRYRRTRVLWGSPECTNHSQAKAKKRSRESQPDLFGETLPDEAAERSRATMWDIPRFAEHHAYDAVVVENVVEAARWVMFPAWLHAMDCLGYAHQIVSLNSMHAPAMKAPRAPQSRDRIYIVFSRHGIRRPDLTPRPFAWCAECGGEVTAMQAWKNGRTVGRYRQQYLYVCERGHVVEPYALPAAAAIDWSMAGTRIGDRTKPLSAKTLARIEAGLRKFHGQVFGTVHRGAPGDIRVVHLDRQAVPTFAASGNHQGPVVPVEGRDGKQTQPRTSPMRTLTARAESALVVPYYGTGAHARPAAEPLGALTTRDRYALLVPSGGTWNEETYPADEPLRTRTATESEGVAFIAQLKGQTSRPWSVDEPLSTVQASGNHHMLVRHNSSRGDGGEMCTPAYEPVRTITTTGHQSLVSIDAQVDDATFRMLEPHEIQAAMAFTTNYQVLGNRRERVRQLGNGVTPPAAEFLLRAVARSLDGSA